MGGKVCQMSWGPLVIVLNHGATAEEMTKMGYKLFNDKATFMATSCLKTICDR